jgi:feruloyl esterase
MRIIAPLAMLSCALLHCSAARAACADLASLSLDGAHIVSAVAVAAGPMSFADANGKPATATLPAFCRVKAVADPGTGFEVWLPEQAWNGQFLSVGSGGFGGRVQLAALAEALLGAYAATSNDTGHTSEDKGWMGDPRKVRLWGHDATHITTAPAKAIVAAFYARPAAHAYFSGCSTGGAQAMTEAQAFPGDYDGIVAGAPGMSYAHLMLSFLWGKQVAGAHPDSKLGPAQLLLLHKAVLAQCDGLDGAVDGLLENPRACRFEPATLQCKDGEDAASCLTPHQVETVRALHDGPRNARTGEQIYPGFEYGSEASAQEPPVDAYSYGWLAIQGPLADIFAIPLLRQMVYRDPAWDAGSFDWDKDVADVDRRVGADITATSPDLRAFRAAGGKLLMYQGWGDPLNGQSLPISYREQVRRASGADVDDYFRVFMAPGMSHCGRGPGPNAFDALAAVRRWVETGAPPERLIASKAADKDAAPMTRPLCPYPAVARWNGEGSLNDEKNFGCSR